MKNYIDSEQHWEDSVNADYDYKKAIEKEQEDNREQPDNREQVQELHLHGVSHCTCNPHKPITHYVNGLIQWTCEICNKLC